MPHPDLHTGVPEAVGFTGKATVRRSQPSAQPNPPRRLLLTLAAPPRGQELLLVDALRRLGAELVDREGERVLGLFPAPADPRAFLDQVRSVVRASVSLEDPDLSWRWASPTEWMDRWDREVGPRRVSDRFRVVPCRPSPGKGPGPRVRDAPEAPDTSTWTIRLLPSLAFGTAEHPTTRSSIRALEEAVVAEDSVVDVGTGTGILGIAAVLLGARRAFAFERDPMGVRAALENIALNGVADQVEVMAEEVRPGTLAPLGPVEGVIANVPPDIFLPLLGELSGALVEGGWMIVSGASRGERGAYVEQGLRRGLQLAREDLEDGWWTGTFRRSGIA